MIPSLLADGRVMPAREASALWRERNWGSAAATGPWQVQGSKYRLAPAITSRGLTLRQLRQA
jgi:hypothetical protein